MKLELKISLPPSVNNYQNYRVRRYGKHFKVEAYPSEDTELFYHKNIKYIKKEITTQRWQTPLPNEYVVVEATMYLSRAGSDADNYFKCSLDALEKSDVVVNDTYIIPRVKNVFIDKDNPRIELKIYVSEKIGVFDSEENMNEFVKNNCDKCCRRRKSQCIIFRGLLENRVHDLDSDGNCKERKIFTK